MVLKKIDNITFFLIRKYTPNATKVEITLLAKEDSIKSPTDGNRIILVITAEIIPIETHLIQ
jgi:hypothetical protein